MYYNLTSILTGVLNVTHCLPFGQHLFLGSFNIVFCNSFPRKVTPSKPKATRILNNNKQIELRGINCCPFVLQIQMSFNITNTDNSF
jgi:hypothetical protein